MHVCIQNTKDGSCMQNSMKNFLSRAYWCSSDHIIRGFKSQQKTNLGGKKKKIPPYPCSMQLDELGWSQGNSISSERRGNHMVVGRKRRREMQENNTSECKVLSVIVKTYICKQYKLCIIMLKIQNIVVSLA